MRAPQLSFVIIATLATTACEPEIGGLCDPDPQEVANAVAQVENTNNLVQDVQLDFCSQGFCMSTDGSRPYCTKVCQTDAQCAEAGPGFVCRETVTFGPLACTDWEDPLKEQPGKEKPASEVRQTCASSSDCTNPGETCFPSGELAQTCGFAGRDCLTGDNDGNETDQKLRSKNPIKYCVAESPEVIAERDTQFGRQPSNK